ncbi:MAG TPA: outer membrane protein assembly factor BamB [Steroidobacteraceae bacterium]|nr:outer membrane protein assembly factor BamB [Steroidobacteraceae bacterium]
MRTPCLRTGAVVAALAVLLVACDSDKDIEPPAALVAIDAKLAVERVWSASLGGKDQSLRLGLAPAVEDGKVYAAGGTGTVGAFDAASGRTLWRKDTKLALAGGPAVGSGLVVVGSSDGQLLALEAASGAQRWLVRLSGEVLAAPVIAPQAVVVRTVDGRVRGLALDTGKELWSNEQQMPRLTLRGISRPALAGDTVVCAFDNGKVAAYGVSNGDVLWDTAVSPPRGKTELERLVDIDGEIAVSGHDVFVAGFQGRVAMIALDSGQVWWSREASSYRGIALAGETIYMTSADSIVSAMRRRDGTPNWQQDRLARRGLTAPAVDGDALVVADFEGYVHWLDQASGALIGRISAGGTRFTNAPVAAGGFVYLENDSGELYALRAQPRK